MKKYFISFLFVCLVLIFFRTEAYARSGDSILLPQTFALVDNGQEEILFSYIAALYRDPVLVVELWDIATPEQRQYYFVSVEEFLHELLNLYLNPLVDERGLGTWFLTYLDWAETFSNSIISPRILQTGEVLFQLPELGMTYFTYMPIRTITNVTSRQWRFKPHLTSHPSGFMKYGEAYSVALGTYFDPTIGNIYRITFANGETILSVLTDVKSDLHTDITNRYADSRMIFDGTRGNILEFVMDDQLPQFRDLPMDRRVAAINQVVRDRFPTPVVEIRKVGIADVMS